LAQQVHEPPVVVGGERVLDLGLQPETLPEVGRAIFRSGHGVNTNSRGVGGVGCRVYRDHGTPGTRHPIPLPSWPSPIPTSSPSRRRSPASTPSSGSWGAGAW